MDEGFDTARLYLRPIEEADEALYCRLYTDADTMRHIGQPLSQEGAQGNFRAMRDAVRGKKPAWTMLVVIERESGHRVGVFGLLQRGTEVEIGSMLLDDWRGRGYSTEVVEALIRRLFASGDVDSLLTRHAGDNRIAERVMHKLGFSRSDVHDDAGGVVWRLVRDVSVERTAAAAAILQ